MGRKTQPLDVHQPRKDPEHGQEAAATSQTYKQQEVAGGVSSEPVLNRIESRDSYDTQEKQPKKYYFWKNWKASHWDKWGTIEKFTFWVAVATITTPLVDIYQSYLMRETFIADQRPALYLGLPDGKVADFVMEGGTEQVALHFRNYGQSAARNAFIETWPTILTSSSAPVAVKIPPPVGRWNGPDIPPGFPVVHYQLYPGTTREELEAGTRILTITGRVRYADASRTYCDTFSLIYNQRVSPRFMLRISNLIDACDRNVDFIETRPTQEK